MVGLVDVSGKLKAGIAAGIVALLAVPIGGLVLLIAAASAIPSIAVNAAASQEGVKCETVAPTLALTGETLGPLPYNTEQVDSAKTIMSVAKALNFGDEITDELRRRAAAIAIATAMQESSLRNLDHGHLDSVGLFQQRPSMAWGSVGQIMDPVYSTTAFFYGAGTNKGMVYIANWATAPLTVVAQAVQNSAHPTLYADDEPGANALVQLYWEMVEPATNLPAELMLERLPEDKYFVGDVECPPAWGDAGGEGEAQPGAWGGHANGAIPASELAEIPWAPGHYLRKDAIEPLTRLNERYKRDHGGKSLSVSSSYRDLAGQARARENNGCHPYTGPCYAAAGYGRSNHGWALALDFNGFGKMHVFTSPNYAWMRANAPDFGWRHPVYMQPGTAGGPKEPWHWEFWGLPAGTPLPTS